MSIFAQRSIGYRTGIILLLFGCVLFIIGFSSPNWTKSSLSYSGHGLSPYGAMYDSEQVKFRGHNGLWVTCSEAGGQTQCASISSNTPGNCIYAGICIKRWHTDSDVFQTVWNSYKCLMKAELSMYRKERILLSLECLFLLFLACLLLLLGNKQVFCCVL